MAFPNMKKYYFGGWGEVVLHADQKNKLDPFLMVRIIDSLIFSLGRKVLLGTKIISIFFVDSVFVSSSHSSPFIYLKSFVICFGLVLLSLKVHW